MRSVLTTPAPHSDIRLQIRRLSGRVCQLQRRRRLRASQFDVLLCKLLPKPHPWGTDELLAGCLRQFYCLGQWECR